MEDKEQNDIIERLKNRRISLGYSYQDLSDKTGISKSTLQRYETGHIKNLSVDKLEILAEALEISPSNLMGWTENYITNAEDAAKYILKQPSLMAYGGYDISKMSDDDLISFANELLKMVELLSHKYKK